MPSRLALGTAQLGLTYGVANKGSPPTRDEAKAILDLAWASGMDTLDTAVAYGDSELRLGELDVARWRVVSKLPGLPEGRKDIAGWVTASVWASLQRLKIQKLSGLLLHRPLELLEPEGEELYAALSEVKLGGLADKIGVSIYAPEDLDELWPRFPVDMVQAPFNVIDQRLATSGWLGRLKMLGVEVHARSVFLQGVLLMDATRRPEYFRRWTPLWNRWKDWLETHHLSALEAALSFVVARSEVDRIIVGVEERSQLEAILGAYGQAWPESETCSPVCSEDRGLVDPTRWVLR
jgi:aryl-alcohol dehydrogenase-like predicted oxidoreductase